MTEFKVGDRVRVRMDAQQANVRGEIFTITSDKGEYVTGDQNGHGVWKSGLELVEPVTDWEKDYYELTAALDARAKELNWCGEWDEFKKKNNIRMREKEYPFPTKQGTVVDVYSVSGAFMFRVVRGAENWLTVNTVTTRTDDELAATVGGGRSFKVTEVPA